MSAKDNYLSLCSLICLKFGLENLISFFIQSSLKKIASLGAIRHKSPSCIQVTECVYTYTIKHMCVKAVKLFYLMWGWIFIRICTGSKNILVHASKEIPGVNSVTVEISVKNADEFRYVISKSLQTDLKQNHPQGHRMTTDEKLIDILGCVLFRELLNEFPAAKQPHLIK